MTILNKIFKRGEKDFFELNRENIYPWVKVIFSDDNLEDSSNQVTLSESDSPIFKPWLADLAIFYVVDMGDHFHVLLKRDLPKKISLEQLHQLSIRNLNGTAGHEIHNTKDNWKLLAAGGDHEAGFICVQYIWEGLSEQLNDHLIVAIPAKDLLLIVPENDSRNIANLVSFVDQIFIAGERLLTKSLFKFDKELKQWKVFTASIENV